MKMAMYKMNHNQYLGNCFSVVCENETIPKGFTRSEVTVFIKTTEEIWNTVNTLEELKQADLFGDREPYLRIASECMFGMMGDSHCNCEQERVKALKKIGSATGVYIHLPQEAQGMGLFYKAKELHLQVHGYLPSGEFVGCQTQTDAAFLLTGHKIIDIREFDFVGKMMHELCMDHYHYIFMSRNPAKVKSLKKSGITIDGMYDIATRMNADNMGEYLTKWIEKGYCFTLDEVEQVLERMDSEEILPVRAKTLLTKAADMLETDAGRAYLKKHLYVSEKVQERLFSAIMEQYGNQTAA